MAVEAVDLSLVVDQVEEAATNMEEVGQVAATLISQNLDLITMIDRKVIVEIILEEIMGTIVLEVVGVTTIEILHLTTTEMTRGAPSKT